MPRREQAAVVVVVEPQEQISNMKKRAIIFGAMASMLLVGCGGGSDEGASTPPPPAAPAAEGGFAGGVPADLKITADAGISVTPGTPEEGAKAALDEALASRVTPRRDPFALLAGEIVNERKESAAKVLDEIGGFTTMFELPEDKPDEEEQVVPAPPGLRLVGVIIANGISGLLEINGQTVDIRPGTRLGAGEDVWIVVSLDEEKAVLRRPGNKRPKEIVVPLSSRLDPLLTGGQPSGGAGAGGGGGEQGGRPGAAGRGRPGEDF